MTLTTDISKGLAGSGSGARVVFSAVSKNFGSTTVLDNLNLAIEPGEFVALLGPSGCGKTTALRILAGFESASAGSLTVDGRDILSVPSHRRGVGMVFQAYSLFPNLSVADNVSFGLAVRGATKAERSVKVQDLLALVGLPGYEERYPSELSGGQQQRVALARALAIEPRVLLLDEPLSALDAEVRASLREEIRELQLRLGITMLFVTHDQEEALAMADRVAVMKAGAIEQIDSPAALYDHPGTEFVARFVGTTNRFSIGRNAAVPEVWRPVHAGETDVLYVRPELLTFEPSPDGAARVVAHIYKGARTRVIARLNDAGESVHGTSDFKVDIPVAQANELPVGTPVNMRLTGRPTLRVEA